MTPPVVAPGTIRRVRGRKAAMSISEMVEIDGSKPWTLDLLNGRSLRIMVEQDESATINDYDADGRISDYQDYARDGRKPRPEGFTGRARKVDCDQGYVWWEPYAELTEDQIRADWPRIRDLIQYGFSGVVVEVLEGSDAYGRPIIREVASLWGIALVGTYQECQSHVREVVAELLDELGIADDLVST